MEILKVDTRTESGTQKARKLRSSGKIPGILYGHGKKTVPIAFDKHDMEVAVQHGERLLQISNKGKKENALIMDIQYDTFGIEILHVDLVRVDLDEKVSIEVEVHLVGTPEGVKAGGVLHQMANSIRVEVPVSDIPEDFKVIVSQLQIGEHMTLNDVEFPQGTRLLDDPEDHLCSVMEVTEEPEPEQPAEESEATEPEVIGEKEGEDEDAEGED